MVCIRSTIRNRLAARTSHASYNFSMDQDLQPILFLSSPTEEASLIKAYISTKWVFEEKCP